ncbi:MAG TPA: MAPEG family protein [Burkholderiales bacterium]|nr:MAPEG family protein [Burkholderiales bacterium]
MPANHLQLIASCLAMVLLMFAVGVAMLFTRIQEMRRKNIHAQAAANSLERAAHFETVQIADNFRNLFEVPVLFFALAAVALATGYVPGWLVICAWVYFALRLVHSFIHCTYNNVYHRFIIFLASFGLLVGMWIVFFVSLASKSAV